MHITDEKNHLRQAIEQRISRLSQKELDAESRSICRRALAEIPAGSTVCAYIAMKTEANLELLINELTSRGDRVFLPCFVQGSGLAFREFTDWDSLSKTPLGFLEPPQAAPEMQIDEPDIILIPGRAFDRDGHRLGRGNGGYDLWIDAHGQKNQQLQYWGIALDCQLVTHVPLEPHDQPMQAVVTSREFIRCQS